jgi:hypothetical protein
MTMYPRALVSVVASVVCLASCIPPSEVVSRQESFARFDPGQRDAVFSRALQVLLSRGWVMAAVDREAGILTTQPRETYVPAWVGYKNDRLQVSIASEGRITATLNRQVRSASKDAGFPGDSGWIPPSTAQARAGIEGEQNAILAEVTAAADVGVLRRCRELALDYAGALRRARACDEIGARVCTGLRPTIEDGSDVLNRSEVSVVASRTADLDRVLAEYRQAGCAFSGGGAPAVPAGDECLGAAGSASCQ